MFELVRKEKNADNVAAFRCMNDGFLEKYKPFSYDEELLSVRPYTTVEIFDGEISREYSSAGGFVFDPLACMDEDAAYEVGVDYYVYLCLNGDDTASLRVSRNGTYPSGSTPETSRKIGGFHYGSVRKVSDDGLWVPVDSNGIKFGSTGIRWQDNVTVGIVPNSVWDLKNRPKVLFGGLAKVGSIWVSIYQASKAEDFTFMTGDNLSHISEGLLQSRYGVYPVSGIDGLCQFNFAELAARSGMRMMKYNEWLAAAYGAPLGEDHANNYGWTAEENKIRCRTGCSVNRDTGKYDRENGVKPYSISAMNIVDTVGNTWEWMGEYTNRHDGPEGVWTYYDQLGPDMGQYYGWKMNSFSSFACGGHWHRGSYCGPRAINPDDQPWNVNVHIGTRLACDAL